MRKATSVKSVIASVAPTPPITDAQKKLLITFFSDGILTHEYDHIVILTGTNWIVGE